MQLQNRYRTHNKLWRLERILSIQSSQIRGDSERLPSSTARAPALEGGNALILFLRGATLISVSLRCRCHILAVSFYPLFSLTVSKWNWRLYLRGV